MLKSLISYSFGHTHTNYLSISLSVPKTVRFATNDVEKKADLGLFCSVQLFRKNPERILNMNVIEELRKDLDVLYATTWLGNLRRKRGYVK